MRALHGRSAPAHDKEAGRGAPSLRRSSRDHGADRAHHAIWWLSIRTDRYAAAAPRRSRVVAPHRVEDPRQASRQATTAMRRPRRAARRSTQACSAARPCRCRQITHAAWISSDAQRGRAGFRDGAFPPATARTIFARHEPQIGGTLFRIGKAPDVIHDRPIRQAHDRPDAGGRHQALHDRIGRRARLRLAVPRPQEWRERVEQARRGARASPTPWAAATGRHASRLTHSRPSGDGNPLAAMRAQQIDRLRPHPHQLLPHPQHPPHAALPRRHPMRAR